MFKIEISEINEKDVKVLEATAKYLLNLAGLDLEEDNDYKLPAAKDSFESMQKNYAPADEKVQYKTGSENIELNENEIVREQKDTHTHYATFDDNGQVKACCEDIKVSLDPISVQQTKEIKENISQGLKEFSTCFTKEREIDNLFKAHEEAQDKEKLTEWQLPYRFIGEGRVVEREKKLTEGFKVPSITEGFKVPSITEGFKVPSITEGFKVPSITEGFKVPSVTEGFKVPSVKRERKKKTPPNKNAAPLCEIQKTENIIDPLLARILAPQKDYSDPKIAYKHFMDVLLIGARAKKLTHASLRKIIKEVTVAANDPRDLYSIDLQKEENVKYIKNVVEKIEALLEE